MAWVMVGGKTCSSDTELGSMRRFSFVHDVVLTKFKGFNQTTFSPTEDFLFILYV